MSATAAVALALRPARPADAAPHAGVYQEWWRLHGVDPRTGRAFFVRIQTHETPELRLMLYSADATGGASNTDRLIERGRGQLLDVADLDRVAGGWRLVVTGPSGKANVTIKGRLGVTAGPWRLGRQDVYTSPPRTENGSINWSALIPAGTLSGMIELGPLRYDVSGWRGYLDHTWGRFRSHGGTWHHWNWGVTHRRASESWVLHGLEPRPGKVPIDPRGYDRNWQGVLVHTTPRGVTSCRPRIRRSEWLPGGTGYSSLFATRVDATCGRRTVTFQRWKSDYRWSTERSAQYHVGTGMLPDRTGFFEHRMPTDPAFIP